MGVRARDLFQLADRGEAIIHIPTMVFAEILYLSERHRIAVTVQQVDAFLVDTPTYLPVPLTLPTILRAAEIDDIPELHDRLIAGTAVAMHLPLITNDPVISQSKDCLAFNSSIWPSITRVISDRNH
jgi:predicted nucleic acid-binding protein